MGKIRLSAMLDTAAGGVGDVVVAQYRGGQLVRRRPRYKRPTSPAQAAASARLAQAAEAWNSLTAEQAEPWRTYAEGVFRHNALTGARYRGNAQTEFTALATKFLQASPSGAVPLVPPSTSYAGDTVVVSVAAGPGTIVWTASGANDADAITELLVQKLPNPRRKPTKQYASAAFVQFGSEGLSYDMPMDAGTYALAYRFVRLSTGQATGLLQCGTVDVPAPSLKAA